MVKPDEIKAYTAYQSACANIDKADLYSVNIIAVENRDEEIGESVKGILQQWQAKLGMYCSISYISESEYDEKLKNGDYTLALTRLNGSYNCPEAYLNSFTDNVNKYSAMNSDYSKLLEKHRRRRMRRRNMSCADRRKNSLYPTADSFPLHILPNTLSVQKLRKYNL